MKIGAVADVHGNFEALSAAMRRHPDVHLWICVGDLASRTGAYPTPVAALYWIKGNNEDFDRIAAFEAGADTIPNLHYVVNGTTTQVGPLVVAGLGGTFAPTWFDTPAAQLPHKSPRDDKRRHFVREEVDALKRLATEHREDPKESRQGVPADQKEHRRDIPADSAVDILMTHEAARPFILVDEPAPGVRPRRRDAGKPAINDVLATLRPRLHLCGHHHRFVETTREGVPSVCIDRINRSYLLIDAGSLEYEKIDQPE